jgi:hypothetical protein
MFFLSVFLLRVGAAMVGTVEKAMAEATADKGTDLAPCSVSATASADSRRGRAHGTSGVGRESCLATAQSRDQEIEGVIQETWAEQEKLEVRLRAFEAKIFKAVKATDNNFGKT